MFSFRFGIRSKSLLFFGLAAVVFGQPGNPDALLKKAIGEHQSGEIGAAIADYRKYLVSHPNSILACANLGAAYAKEARYSDAIAQYRQALKLQPGNAPIQMNLALSYYKTGQIEQAVEQLEQVHRAAPEEQQPLLLLADCWLTLGENKKVAALLETEAARRPNDLAIAYTLGTAFIRDGRMTEGQLVIDRILRNGDSAEARLLLGTAKLTAKDYPAALADLKKAVELNPNLPDANTYLGQALLGTGDSGAAADAFRKSLEANQNDFNANLFLAVLLKDDDKFDEAETLLKRALRVRPRDPLVRYQLATLSLKRESGLVAAQKELETITKEVPAFTEAHVALATIYYREKRKEDGDRERATVQRLNRETQLKQQQGINVK